MPPVVPDSLAKLLSLLAGPFTAPSFDTFRWLVCGFIGRVGEHTITGVWQAARLAGVFHHSRAHDFFARRRWSVDELGLALAELIVDRFLGPEEPITVAVDETLFPRSGPKVFASSWQFDSRSASRTRLKRGNSFVVLGIVIRPKALGHRPLCLPVLFRRWRPAAKDEQAAVSRCELAQRLVALIAERFAERRVEMLADAYYANRRLRDLPDNSLAIVRLRKDSALWSLPPERVAGQIGRPRTKGSRIGSPASIAADPKSQWQELEIRGCDGATETLQAIVLGCLWYSVLGPKAVRVVLCREAADQQRPGLHLLCTDPGLPAAEIVSRFHERWSIETAFQNAKGTLGVGEARNRVRRAVERTVPFGFICQSITVCWYLMNGDAQADVAARRRNAPWYSHKRLPSFADMLVSLRRELIAAEFRSPLGSGHSDAEIQRLGLAPLELVA